MRAILFCVLLLALLAAPVYADEKEQIIGTWKLVSVMYEDQETKALTPVLGNNPRGSQIATRDGRWLALVTADNRPVPKTDEERAQALRTMISYSGRYRVEGNKVTTKVEIAWNEAWVGGEQVRLVRFEGDKLFIEARPCRIRMWAEGRAGDRGVAAGEVIRRSASPRSAAITWPRSMASASRLCLRASAFAEEFAPPAG
jgi:hypothetical protein